MSMYNLASGELRKENDDLRLEIERLQKDLTYYQEYSADLLNKNNTFESIINELEEDIKLESNKIREHNDYNMGLHNAFAYIRFKLQELKGSDNDK